MTVYLYDPGTPGFTLAVSIPSPSSIQVALGTDGGGALTSTAAQVRAAVLSAVPLSLIW